MDDHHLYSFDENCWSDLIDYSNLLNDVEPIDLSWNPPPHTQSNAAGVDVSLCGTISQGSECAEKECLRNREHGDLCREVRTKACRERIRREKLNNRFSELCAILELGRPVKFDKLAILGDAIKVLNQLKAESEEYKEMNEKLLEEIRILKAEKNELRDEKLVLRADKERMEQQLKAMPLPPAGFMPAHPPVYLGGSNKMPMYPGYSFVPMWQYLPQYNRDTSQDHKLRPPAA
ncbi:transcription factor bHLH104-like [Olea europaea subsp. europaea]|uniref:Transcription factor bHLH104-like n=1 Tax=Olea europaea subsp. europaea TaxID=158383 RepID=A0A8S0TV61_OLEEU|nr:transcription factor bHLH104-like [Olea europaea subsp. europaea]